jgi:hypothetical protein
VNLEWLSNSLRHNVDVERDHAARCRKAYTRGPCFEMCKILAEAHDEAAAIFELHLRNVTLGNFAKGHAMAATAEGIIHFRIDSFSGSTLCGKGLCHDGHDCGPIEPVSYRENGSLISCPRDRWSLNYNGDEVSCPECRSKLPEWAQIKIAEIDKGIASLIEERARLSVLAPSPSIRLR